MQPRRRTAKAPVQVVGIAPDHEPEIRLDRARERLDFVRKGSQRVVLEGLGLVCELRARPATGPGMARHQPAGQASVSKARAPGVGILPHDVCPRPNRSDRLPTELLEDVRRAPVRQPERQGPALASRLLHHASVEVAEEPALAPLRMRHDVAGLANDRERRLIPTHQGAPRRARIARNTFARERCGRPRDGADRPTVRVLVVAPTEPLFLDRLLEAMRKEPRLFGALGRPAQRGLEALVDVRLRCHRASQDRRSEGIRACKNRDRIACMTSGVPTEINSRNASERLPTGPPDQPLRGFARRQASKSSTTSSTLGRSSIDSWWPATWTTRGAGSTKCSQPRALGRGSRRDCARAR